MKPLPIVLSIILISIGSISANAQTKVAKKKNLEKRVLSLTKDSYFGFVGAKVTGDHSGNFSDFEGTISIRGNKVESLKILIKTASLVSTEGEMPTGIAEKFEAHLRSVDFLDATEFPRASFESTTIEKHKKGKDTHLITGNLEIRGIKKSITFPARIMFKNNRVDAKAEFIIDRSLFGIIYKGKADDLIKNEVLLKIKLNAIRRK